MLNRNWLYILFGKTDRWPDDDQIKYTTDYKDMRFSEGWFINIEITYFNTTEAEKISYYCVRWT